MTRKLGLALAAALMLPATTAQAADIDTTPLLYDWSGVYMGAFGAWGSFDGSYDYVCGCGTSNTNVDLKGSGFRGGIMGGFNYQMDSVVWGLEGDFDFGGEIADNNAPTEDTYLNVDNIGTLRARAGVAMDNTLFYATGGAAFVNAEFGSGTGVVDSDSGWTMGWTLGGGIEHAFTENLTARLEYLYVGLPGQDYKLKDGSVVDVDLDSEAIHMVRLGIAYKF